MLRLITDGPGWTDDITFLKWESKQNDDVRLIGIASSTGDIIAITKQPYEDAVKDLTSIHGWTNEEDGTNNYLEGDNPDNFDSDYWDLDEENLFEESFDFDNVSDFLDFLNYKENNEEDSDETVYYRNEAEDYLKAQGIDVEDEDVSELLDETGSWSDEDGGYMFTQEDLDNIINQLKK